jgi:phage tail sheath protein FI
MAVQVSYPGVYIDEFAPGAPIEGVGTGTAAFLGPTERGLIAARVDASRLAKVTSFDQFLLEYGETPLPGVMLWYAVRGFFENGGKVCYVARVSNGDYESLLLDDSVPAPNNLPLATVIARQPGVAAPVIQVAVVAKAATFLTVANSSLYQPAGALSAPSGIQDVTLNAGQGALFRPGDVVTVAAAGERLMIQRVTGDTLRFSTPVTGAYVAGDAVRLADAPAGTRTFRVTTTAAPAVATAALQPGALLTVAQGGSSDSQVIEAVQQEFLPGPLTTYRVTFRSGVTIPISLAAAATVNSEEFNLTVAQGAGTTTYADLEVDAAHANYWVRRVNDDPGGLVRIELIEPPPPVRGVLLRPAFLAATALAGGVAENLATIGDNDYIAALDALRRIDDINLVSAPDASIGTATLTPVTVQQAMITHCEQLADRFAVLDSPAGAPLFGANSVESHRPGVASQRGYGALYYPWIRVRPSGSGGPILVPPSGHVCGIMARTDANRGVHKAPANETVNGAVGVERMMSDDEQGILNLQGINVIRVFGTGARPMLWGARTTATDRNWQYVNIRRLFLFLEESIQDGIRWAVFEPNNLGLWQKLRRSIRDFLTQQWRNGALFGEEPDDAFYVRIDEVLNPFSEQALGRLHIEIGVRPSYPAEFIIVRIGIWQGGSEVTET